MNEASVLFLVSNDFGELSSALDFMRGTNLRARLLLPRRLLQVSKGIFDVPAGDYGTLHDVITALDSDRPDIVFLFSGYLYAINRIFDLTTVEALLAELERRRLRVVTSDPFLGLLRTSGTAPFSEQHPARHMLTQHFKQVAAALDHVIHLYPGPADALPGKRKLSFFNPATIGQQPAPPVQRSAVDGPSARWLFVLSAEDYNAQVIRLGRESFEAILADRLADAARAGRQPVLVAPQPCVEAMADARRAVPGLRALPYCGYHEFASLIMESEQVFCWNMVSHFLKARLANRLPVCFFDHGHLLQAIPPLLPLAVDTYFAGARPVLRDARAALDPDQLAGDAARQIEALSGAVERQRGCPAPSEIVALVMREPPARA